VIGALPPALIETIPGMQRTPDLAWHGSAEEQARGHREIAAIGGDHGPRQPAREAFWRARRAEGLDLPVAVEVLAAAIADAAWVSVEDRVERRHVVSDKRLLVAVERGPHLRHDVGQVDVHACAPAVAGRQDPG